MSALLWHMRDTDVKAFVILAGQFMRAGMLSLSGSHSRSLTQPRCESTPVAADTFVREGKRGQRARDATSNVGYKEGAGLALAKDAAHSTGIAYGWVFGLPALSLSKS